MKYTNAAGISLNVTPYFEKGFVFEYLHMKEEIGGDLARGEMLMHLDGSSGSVELVDSGYTGHITLDREEGNIYEIDFFIYDKKFLNNDLTIKFLCVPSKEFFIDLKVSTWDDISGAINSLYPGQKRIECESDVNNEVPFYQQRETDYEFCKKLCYSFKHDIVFSFGFEGLLLKETISKDHLGNSEPFLRIWGDQEATILGNYSFKYNNLLYEEPINPWGGLESDTESLPDRTKFESLNCQVMRTYNEYRIMGRSHFQALENRRFNERYLKSDLWTVVKILNTNLPIWKIGDVVFFIRRLDENPMPFDTFLIKSNEIFFSIDTSVHTDSRGLKFSWVSELLGLKQSGETFPSEDPTNTNK